jgi:hypothetical protein
MMLDQDEQQIEGPCAQFHRLAGRAEHPLGGPELEVADANYVHAEGVRLSN